MISAEEKLDALRKFTGDVHIYKDGTVSLFATVDRAPDSWGANWDDCLERLARRQRKSRSSSVSPR